MGELTVGIAGLGLGRHFVAACAAAPQVARLVICDPDQGRCDEIAGTFDSVAETYADLGAMLTGEQLDAAFVITPDHLHREHVEACLAAGCHVLMTKPLATNLDDARAIVRAAEGSGRTLMVAHERRFRARFAAVRAMLHDGMLGEPILIQLNQVGDRRRQFANAPWYASPEAGRSAIVGSGIHEVDLLRFFVARQIETVSAASNRLGGLEFPKAKTTATVFQFAGGAIGQTAICYEAHWPPGKRAPAHFQVVATRGVVDGSRYRTDGDDDWQDLPGDDGDETAAGCAGAVRAFLAAVGDGGAVPVTPRDAYATLAACIAADESAASGRTVRPDPEDF